jgi:cullin 1
VNQFAEFYGDKHIGRKLSWLFNRSTAEILTTGYSNRYTFVMSTLQAGVILLFNDRDLYTMRELLTATALTEEILVQILQIFLKMKLLISSSGNPTEALTPDTELSLFKEYKNKKLRVNINVPLRYETKVEEDRTKSSVDEERKYVLQAAIVKIMKDRKTLGHQQLIAEVIGIVEGKFQPSVPIIKVEP